MSVIISERIDFNQLSKPANLKNSAVLRMLEEEENRKRNGHPRYYCGVKNKIHIEWPPENVINSNGQKNLNWISSKLPGVKQVVWPPPPDFDEYATVEEAPVHAQGGPQYHNQQTSPVQQIHKSVSPNFAQHPPQHQQQPQSPLSSPQSLPGSQGKGWAPVHSPVAVQSQPQYPQQPTQTFRPPAPIQEPPPSTITLRPFAPISQAPASVYTSQPATASLQGNMEGGTNMRGDQKWPPASVKTQMQVENDQRRQLAKGPAFRPRKVKKDYSTFFAQHALNSTYPGYRAPPGTQHYTEENSGITNF